MRKFVKILSTVVFIVVCFFLLLGVDIFEAEPKEFNAAGITITLNDDFIISESVVAPLYLVATDHIFIGMRESKSSINNAGIYNLQDYADAVLANNGHAGETTYESDDEGATYIYAYFTATVEDIEYGYMLICMKSDNYYYSMNFGCLEKNLEKFKAQYHEWADTIIVE